MNTSLFELFKIGIGPSSSHTVGPMRAARRFIESVAATQPGAAIVVDLYGSLALTGLGHGTDRAILMGLLGEAPDTVDLDAIPHRLDALRNSHSLEVRGRGSVRFDPAQDLRLHREQMYPDADRPTHPNGMRFQLLESGGGVLLSQVFYSIGGGFIVTAEEFSGASSSPARNVPYPFRSAADLLATASAQRIRIAELVLANEVALLEDRSILRPEPALAHSFASPEDEVRQRVLSLWRAMQACMERGIATEGILPGGLNVRRRAPGLSRRIEELEASGKPRDPLAPLDWVSLFAIAVNEENAAGGRVVTAPTNGAAGVIPAIAHYYMRFVDNDQPAPEKEAGLMRYFLTAAAIGILYKENASISGAEVGCQGEVGVACSMAAAGLVAALGGSNEQVEHAAEIAMEHNLGMTCDPIGGLVQIPCIERNAMGAVKAVNACRMAMHETEGHKLSLDQVIHTMYQTGLDMQSRYKETSLAGLALNIIEC